MENDKKKDSMFEALFRQAVVDNFERELQALPSEVELAETIVFSERHISIMRKMFARDNRNERFKTIVKWSRRIAAIVLLTISLLFGALMTVQEIRASVVDTVIKWFEQFTLFTSHGTINSLAHVEPSYIPEGYIETDRMETDEMISIIYMDSYGETLSFLVVPLDSHILVDNEEMTYAQIIVGDVTYYVFSADVDDKHNSIVWEAQGNMHSVSALLSVETLLRVAQSTQ
jgi:hypothetical protein